MFSHASFTDDKVLTRQWLSQTLLAQLAFLNETHPDSEVAGHYLHYAALGLGRALGEHYRSVSRPDAVLSDDEFMRLLYEIGELLEGAPTVARHSGHAITLSSRECPWSSELTQVPGVCRLVTGMYGALTAWNYGYARVALTRGHANHAGGCRLHLYLRPDRDDTRQNGDVFTRAELDSLTPEVDPSSVEALNQYYQRALQAEKNHRHANRESDRGIENLLHAQAVEMPVFRRMHDDLLSKVSHELRTPITTLYGYLSLLQQEMLGGMNAEQHEAVNIALRNIERLNRLVNDLIDYASLTRGEFTLGAEPVDIAEVCQISLRHTSLEAVGKGITIEQQVPEGLGTVLGDRRRLMQVLEHLLENAIKFSDNGASVRLCAYRVEPHVHLEVSDTGIGMTTDQLNYAFTPFVQGDNGLARRYEGLGMGLSLIQNLVKLHGGDIAISSQPGQGTTVRVSLPLLGNP